MHIPCGTPFLERNDKTVRHPLPGVRAVPSTRIPGGRCPAHCGYPPPLVKAGLREPGTGAAFQRVGALPLPGIVVLSPNGTISTRLASRSQALSLVKCSL